jgi:signal transduction histidine kinase
VVRAADGNGALRGAFGKAATMSLGLRAKEVLIITLLTFLVVTTTTVVHLSHLTRLALEQTLRQADLIARQIYAQSARSLSRAPGSGDRREMLRQDAELRTLLNATVEYSPYLLSALIADETGRAILHSDPRKEGQSVPEKPRFKDLLGLDPLTRVRRLYSGEPAYEAVLPLTLDDKPFATIRLGIGMALVRSQLQDSLKQSLALGGFALLAALGVAIGLVNLTLRSIRRLSQDVAQLTRREFTVGPGAKDEFGRLGAQLQVLGEQIQSDRERMLTEKAHFQHTVDHLEDGIMFFNSARRILFLNRAAEIVVGKPVAEVVGEPIDAVLEAGHPLRQIVEQAFQRLTNVRNATIAIPTEAATTEFLVSVFVVTDNGQGCDGAMVLVKDLKSVTVSARTLQSLIKYSAQLTALGRITSEVTHEVKNPLNAMMVHVELLKDRLTGTPEEVRQSLDVIRSEIARLDAVVQKFTNVMRPPEPTLKPVDLNGLLQDLPTLLDAEWRKKGITFTLDLDPVLAGVLGDEEMLRTALMNILLNAYQAMPAGGTVAISSAQEDHKFVTVSISDTGPGIPAEDIDKVFTMYYTTKAQGSGVGLPLVRRIVEMHEGDIEILSTVGRGTTVIIRLPLR